MSSIAEELERFARLLEQGLITREEFDQQKALLLGHGGSGGPGRDRGSLAQGAVIGRSAPSGDASDAEAPGTALTEAQRPVGSASTGGGSLAAAIFIVVALLGVILVSGSQHGGWLDANEEAGRIWKTDLLSGELCGWEGSRRGRVGIEEFGLCESGEKCMSWENREPMQHEGKPGYGYRCP